MKPLILWDWSNFGVAALIFKNLEGARYRFSIDIQIGWLNLWIQVWKR